MSFSVRAVDVTTIKSCDAIINSLGILENVTRYGRLCKNIVAGANSIKLKKEIESFKNNAYPGNIFLTSGYELPAKHIIHIVTPLFEMDKDLKVLEESYKKALVVAYKKGYKKIGIPLIGTGFNGYPRAYVIKLLISIVKDFANYVPKMKIIVAIPIESAKDFSNTFDENEIKKSINKFFDENKGLEKREFHFTFNEFLNLAKENNNLTSCNENAEKRSEDFYESLYSSQKRIEKLRFKKFLKSYENLNIDKNELLNWGKRPTIIDMQNIGKYTITNYINAYIEQRYYSSSEIQLVKQHVYDYVGGIENQTSVKKKHDKEESRSNITTPTLMRYILALHMDLDEAIQLLSFCGRAFSPASERDFKYKELIKRKVYDKFVVHEYCINQNIDQIFNYDF